MMSCVIYWELEYASPKDGDHQQQAALMALTPLGTGRAGTVRKLKTHRAQPRTRRAHKKQSRQKSWKRWNEVHRESDEDPWAGMDMDKAEEASHGLPANAESWEATSAGGDRPPRGGVERAA